MSPDQQANFGSGSRAGSQFPAEVSAIAVRGVGQLFDMQMTAVRTVLQTQARTAAALGWPDCSDWFNGGSDDRLRRTLSSGTEQLVNTAQRTGEAVAEIQRQVGRVIESQAQTAAQSWQHGLEQLGSQADESLKQLRETARQQAEQLQRATQSMADAGRAAVDESAQRGRQAMSQIAETQRQQGDQAAESVQSAAEERSKRSRAA